MTKPESNYTQFVQIESNTLWSLMIPPITKYRYNPREFHIGMWDEWTGKVCKDHEHLITKNAMDNTYRIPVGL